MKKRTTLWVATAVLTFCSCGQPSLIRDLSDESVGFAAYSVSDSYGYGPPAQTETDSSLQTHQSEPDRVETAERKIIKRGNIRFETADVNETKSLITQTVQDLNGYISDDNVDGYSTRLEHRLTIRVPADKFDSLLQTISASVNKFDSKKIEALDVTEEYIDVASRIKSKKEILNRYTELLKQAAKVEEILLIEKEIGSLQTEIESVEGRLRYLTDRIAFSTLNVTYYQEIESQEEVERLRFVSEFADGISNGWEGFLWFIIGLSYCWVFILLAVLIYCLRLWRKKKK